MVNSVQLSSGVCFVCLLSVIYSGCYIKLINGGTFCLGL